MMGRGAEVEAALRATYSGHCDKEWVFVDASAGDDLVLVTFHLPARDVRLYGLIFRIDPVEWLGTNTGIAWPTIHGYVADIGLDIEEFVVWGRTRELSGPHGVTYLSWWDSPDVVRP